MSETHPGWTASPRLRPFLRRGAASTPVPYRAWPRGRAARGWDRGTGRRRSSRRSRPAGRNDLRIEYAPGRRHMNKQPGELRGPFALRGRRRGGIRPHAPCPPAHPHPDGRAGVLVAHPPIKSASASITASCCNAPLWTSTMRTWPLSSSTHRSALVSFLPRTGADALPRPAPTRRTTVSVVSNARSGLDQTHRCSMRTPCAAAAAKRSLTRSWSASKLLL